MSMKLSRLAICCGALWLALLQPISGSAAPAPFVPPAATVKQPQGSAIIPDHFLRSWDPVTLFFNSAVGPQQPGPEDHPERFVTLTPEHPGSYTWLDGRTLQFRPSEAWPPLSRFTWAFNNQRQTLTTLMEPPRATQPSDGSHDLAPVETISLTFSEPLDPATLAKLIKIELSDLPGVSSDRSRWLDSEDFQVKVMERQNRNEGATYLLLLNEPIPAATQAVIHLRLSLDDKVEQSFKQIRFATAAPFRVTHFGCTNNRYPAAPGGVRYPRDQAIQCNPGNRTAEVYFSNELGSVTPIEARNLIHITPAVGNLSFQSFGRLLTVKGDFQADTLYRLDLTAAPLHDTQNRTLELHGEHELYFHFPAQPAFLDWESSQGIVELLGPQMVPLKGRGFDRLDLRIYPIDPLDRSFWPFPSQPLVVDESKRPPGPGEQAAPYTNPNRAIMQHELIAQVEALGSPAISELVKLPLRKHGASAKFGLDLQQYLRRINSGNRPGSYLVGIRKLDGSTARAWIRIQVTDLSLTAIEESNAVRFVVTSLSSGQVVPNATITIEGSRDNKWATIGSGTTDGSGAFTWQAPGYDRYHRSVVRRIVVNRGEDTLVLDPANGPEQFANNQWSKSYQSWLGWTTGLIESRLAKPQTLCHLFTERPIYKPEEEVHIKGYLRSRFKNRLEIVKDEGELVIVGPGEREWRYPFTPTEAGSLYQKFAEEKLPTGSYTAHLELKKHGRCGSVTFEKEAYRLPSFEVQLHGDDIVSLDKEFKVSLSARYYAGGQVVDRPVRWRATQFPYTWTPEKREGFYYSSDGRFAGRQPFRSSAALQQEGSTDDQGAATLTLNPTAEATAQPRSYVIEATVTGADDQTVSTTYQVHALPPLVLGLKAPRYLEKATTVTPEILVAGPDGKLLAGQSVNVKLIKRRWHSHLLAGDFSQNNAKYVTEVVDETISTTTVTSRSEPLPLPLTLQGSGVYIVELEAQDRLGRSQVVAVDFYAGGTEAQTWSQPTTKVFKVTPDRASYKPGDTAHLILESPFQRARALAIVETADGNRYEWLTINNGAATFDLPIEKGFTPRLPVHFVLMRGRIAAARGEIDLGKPATLAATTWVAVEPVENRLEIQLKHNAKAQPGTNLDIDIELRDPSGKPLAGEVTLWLVDQAVLALGKEQRLDPLPDFITDVTSRMQLRDTRNLAFGYLPFAEQPGGDAALEMAGKAAQLMDKVSLRRNFKTVPYYNPAIQVGADGHARVTVALPDNLTVFKIRAKAVSGPERLGFAKSEVAVRLPVLVQPALPRFVRPGDEFVATAIGRIVEGDGGPGLATVKTEGLDLLGNNVMRFEWQAKKPEKLRFKVKVPSPSYDEKGKLSRTSVSFTAAVERSSDQARDAFEVSLPLQPDRSPLISRAITPLAPGESFKLPAIDEPVRSGTLRRSLLLSDQPGLIRMAAGLNYLLEYPHGCTEQRISRARAYIAMAHFRSLVSDGNGNDEEQRVITQTLDWLNNAVDSNGLTGYWPGSKGYVSLTAWSLLFMDEAIKAGYPVNEEVRQRMITALHQSLRSDYRFFITGESYTERTMALWALATTGTLESGYAAELARKANYLNLESLAQVIRVLQQSRQGQELIAQLNQRLWQGIVFRLQQGKEIYGGLQEQASSRNALILPSEARTLAEILHTLQQSNGDNPRVQTLVNALITLGQGDGWGNTNATVSALLALNDFVADDPNATDKGQTVDLLIDGRQQSLQLGGAQHLLRATSIQPNAIEATLPATATTPIAIRAETRYLPQADGAQVAAKVNGFAVRRELLKWLSNDEPLQRLEINSAGQEIALQIGDVIEDHVEVVNSEDRTYVAVVVPLAAGMEPLNPHLATAPAEARTKGSNTLEPTYAAYLDDQVTFYYDSLPKGNYHFYFRTRATIEGRFIQPAAYAEKMYEEAVNGNSFGTRIVISTPPEQ